MPYTPRIITPPAGVLRTPISLVAAAAARRITSILIRRLT